MRLWSIHPRYLDTRGLVALWREGLLAQSVLLGNTRGYKNHPQLLRFKNTDNQVGAIATYLSSVADEAMRRGYHFDSRKIVNRRIKNNLAITDSQLDYEFQHLLKKLKKRDLDRYRKLKNLSAIEQHPLFDKVKGCVESWEII